MRRSLRMALAAGIAIVAIAAAAPASSATTASRVLGSGSDTIYPLMVTLDTLYNGSPGCEAVAVSPTPQPYNFHCLADTGSTVHGENYAHDQVTEAYPLGSSTGIHQLCNQNTAGNAHINFARSSRVPKSSDCTGLNFTGIMKDGLTWECWTTTNDGTGTSGCNSMLPSSGGAGLKLTTKQLSKIWGDCTISNWSQVGGGEVPIDVYTAQPGSGTQGTWEGFLGLSSGGSYNCIPSAFQKQPDAPGSHIAEEHHNALIDSTNAHATRSWCTGPSHSCADQANAIYYISAGRWNTQYATGTANADGSELGRVNGVYPSPANILSGTFPFSRYVFDVYCVGDPLNDNKCGTASPATQPTLNYVGTDGWICKSETEHTANGTSGSPTRDPFTHIPYRGVQRNGKPTGEIPQAMAAAGFVPLAKENDGTYCVSQTT